MMAKIHYRVDIYEGRGKVIGRYLCNYSIKANKERMSYEKKNITCKNCLRILENFPMDKDKTKKVFFVASEESGDE
ncbi:MAG: hypothetical protein ACOCP4_04495 [Candidatus Woesearchaeota archaeon]